MLLRDRWGITATEADHGMPAWEVDMLLGVLRGAMEQPEEAPEPGLPDTLKEWS